MARLSWPGLAHMDSQAELTWAQPHRDGQAELAWARSHRDGQAELAWAGLAAEKYVRVTLVTACSHDTSDTGYKSATFTDTI